MHAHTHVDDAARRYDPTGTTDLRRRFMRDSDRRWARARAMIGEEVGANDALALRPSAVAPNAPQNLERWLRAALEKVVLGGDGGWVEPYLAEATARARQSAQRAVGRSAPPASRDAMHSAQTRTEMRGVVEATIQQAMRAAHEATRLSWTPAATARAMQDRVFKIGRERSRLTVDTSVSRAFNDETIEAFRAMGVTHVGVDPERLRRRPRSVIRAQAVGDALEPDDLVEVLTRGDEDVCQECEDISVEGPYTLDEAQGLIPAHPRCRCAFVPWDDARFAEVEHDT